MRHLLIKLNWRPFRPQEVLNAARFQGRRALAKRTAGPLGRKTNLFCDDLTARVPLATALRRQCLTEVATSHQRMKTLTVTQAPYTAVWHVPESSKGVACWTQITIPNGRATCRSSDPTIIPHRHLTTNP